jgi:hypothetical protein
MLFAYMNVKLVMVLHSGGRLPLSLLLPKSLQTGSIRTK